MSLDNISTFGNRNSQHSFAKIPSVNSSRSVFDRSFAVKDTMDFDYLNPIFLDEVLPGDTCNVNVKSFIRLATQVVPVMDNIYVDFFFFFVPTRLVWSNWERFNGSQDDPSDTVDYLIPRIATATTFTVGTLADKFGLPTDVTNITTLNRISALPFRAYNLIWNSWFRCEYLQDSVTVNLGDGPDALSDTVLLKRGRRHDYFTSMLPWPQKGTAISLPLGTTAPVVSSGSAVLVHGGDSVDRSAVFDGTTNILSAGGAAFGTSKNMYFGSITGLQVNLSSATAATINQFRQAMMTQSLLELDARGGTRYVEIIKAHFNVVNPDFRLQRPEFLSGGSISIVQHPVAQTSESNTTDLASLAAFSTGSHMGNNIGFTKSFTEHGYIIGLAMARADITYQQGINKLWSRETRFDFFWPKLQELGEQPVYNREWYAQATSADADVAGYQERYAEYRYKPSEIHGQFRSTYSASLDVWHLAEEFSSLPALNASYIQNNTPIERCLAVAGSYPHLLCDYFFVYKHTRPMMVYGVPATLGRF